LDYSGVPFKCIRCHRYGHIAQDCGLSFQKKIWVQKNQVVGGDKAFDNSLNQKLDVTLEMIEGPVTQSERHVMITREREEPSMREEVM
jgi:hypothetical protein